jgi:hypothetical protein
MFEVTGQLAGKRRTVVWDDGQLNGDAAVVEEVRLLVASGRPLALTPTGPMVTAALDPPAVACRTIAEVFDTGTVQVDGDMPVPEPADLPDGAIP